MYTRLFRNEGPTSARARGRRGARRRASPWTPVLVVLEDRCLLSFLAGNNFSAGPNPEAIAAGNFRGTEQDLAVVNDNGDAQNGTVSVLLGDGHGNFQSPVAYPVGMQPSAVAVADLLGNGISDLVVTNRASDTVSVLLGNGDGTFQNAIDFPTGGGPRSVAIGDFNGDGIPDLAVTQSSGANAVNVLLGNGDGSFQAPVAYAAGFAPISVATASLTPSGHLDLVVANELDKTLSVLLGNGDGTFQNAVTYDAGNGTFSDAVVVGDFTGNGIPDIAVANDSLGPQQSLDYVGVLMGNGDGTFQPAVSYQWGSQFSPNQHTALVVSDFNHNGILDLAGADFRANEVDVLLGNGDGSFGHQQTLLQSGNPTGLATADFNGDGFPDLATTLPPFKQVTVFLNAGDGHDNGAGSAGARGSGRAANFASVVAAANTIFAVTPRELASPVASSQPVTVSAVDAAFSANRPDLAAPPMEQLAAVDVSPLPHPHRQDQAEGADPVWLSDVVGEAP